MTAAGPGGDVATLRGTVWMLLAKDLRVELRARDTVLALTLVAFMTLLTGLLSFNDAAGGEEAPEVASAILWTGMAFASAVGLARAFGAEKDRGTLDTLLTLPVERGTIFLAKAASSTALLSGVALLTVPTYLWIADEPLPPAWWALAALFALGAVGLAATGTMLSALAAQTRTRDLLMPVLMLPLLAPVLIAGVHGTHDVLHGAPWSEWRGELLLLAGYDVAFLAAGVPLFEAAVEG